MPNALKYEAAWVSRGSVLGSELNALATGSASAVGSTVLDNSANLDQLSVAEFVPGASFTPGSGTPFAALYAVESLNGTDYVNNVVTGAAEFLPSATFCGFFEFPPATAGSWRAKTLPFRLTPGKYKYLLLNESGTSLPATGSVVNIYTTNDEIQ